MKNACILLCSFFVLSDAVAAECISGGKIFEVSECRETVLCAKSNTNEIVLEENIENVDKIQCLDANFDGDSDILVSHSPSGQIKMTSVYLFDSGTNNYEKNDRISELPCLEIDPNTKTISGTCFSSSMCDRWSERYKYKGLDLELISIQGTYCEPATGNAYSYLEIYDNGRITQKIVKEIIDK